MKLRLRKRPDQDEAPEVDLHYPSDWDDKLKQLTQDDPDTMEALTDALDELQNHLRRKGTSGLQPHLSHNDELRFWVFTHERFYIAVSKRPLTYTVFNVSRLQYVTLVD